LWFYTTPDEFEAVDLRHVAAPTAYIATKYASKEFPLVVWTRPPSIEVHSLTDPTRIRTRIPLFSTTHFWEDVVPQQGADAFHPKQRASRHRIDA
jgi:hypothetical protein